MRFLSLYELSARRKTGETADVKDAYRTVEALRISNSSTSDVSKDGIVEWFSKGITEPR